MNKDYPQVTLAEARHWADIAKTLPSDRVELLQNFVRQRMTQAGFAPGVTEIVDGMTERLADEERALRKKLMEEELRRNGVMAQETIEADDDQIVLAIKQTLPHFKHDRDWGGIYRILADYCPDRFKTTKTKFTQQFWEMGIYATDNPKCLNGLGKKFPAIYQDEYHGHQFSYQAIQKGCPTSWPKTYYAWQKKESADRDFNDRRNIARIFLDNLRRAVARRL